MLTGTDMKKSAIWKVFVFWITLNTALAHHDICYKSQSRLPNNVNIYFLNRNILTIVNESEGYDQKYSIEISVISNRSGYFDESSLDLCVGWGSISSHSGEVEITTDTTVPTGVITVNKACYDEKRYIASCDPKYYPRDGVLAVSPLVYPPGSYDFWSKLKDKYIFERNWILNITIHSRNATIPIYILEFLNISSLVNLEITGNNWPRPRTLLSRLPFLKVLNFTNNSIAELPEDIFDNTPQLTHLILANNNLALFPKGLQKLNFLLHIDITNPKVSAELGISDAELSTIKQVQEIRLENVNLKTSIRTLMTLPKMTFLNVSGCGINSIIDIERQNEPTTTESMLKYLDLSRNRISELPSRLFLSFKNLRELYLEGNMLNTCPLYILKHLKFLTHLDLSYNRISEVDPHCFLQQRRLKHLDLSSNHLETIRPNTFCGLSELINLNISNNHISLIPVNTINCLKSVEKIDLGGNKFDCCNTNISFLKELLKQREGNIMNLGARELIKCYSPNESSKTYVINCSLQQALSPRENYCLNGNEIGFNYYAIATIILSVVVVILVCVLFWRRRTRVPEKKDLIPLQPERSLTEMNTDEIRVETSVPESTYDYPHFVPSNNDYDVVSMKGSNEIDKRYVKLTDESEVVNESLHNETEFVNESVNNETEVVRERLNNIYDDVWNVLPFKYF